MQDFTAFWCYSVMMITIFCILVWIRCYLFLTTQGGGLIHDMNEEPPATRHSAHLRLDLEPPSYESLLYTSAPPPYEEVYINNTFDLPAYKDLTPLRPVHSAEGAVSAELPLSSQQWRYLNWPGPAVTTQHRPGVSVLPL